MLNGDKPDYCFSSNCPLASSGTGFCLDSGDPLTAKIGLWLEAPGAEEIETLVSEANLDADHTIIPQFLEEQGRREAAYPEIEKSLLETGVPAVGRAGWELNWNLLKIAGISRSQVFVGNTLRCKPPVHGDSNYPTGDIRIRAESCCRAYDRWALFQPDVAVITMHPAALLRDPTPRPLVIEDLRKARDFAAAGQRVLVLMGGKAAKVFLGYGENVTRWRGHYQKVTEETWQKFSKRMEDGLKLQDSNRKTKRAKKTKKTESTRKKVDGGGQ